MPRWHNGQTNGTSRRFRTPSRMPMPALSARTSAPPASRASSANSAGESQGNTIANRVRERVERCCLSRPEPSVNCLPLLRSRTGPAADRSADVPTCASPDPAAQLPYGLCPEPIRATQGPLQPPYLRAKRRRVPLRRGGVGILTAIEAADRTPGHAHRQDLRRPHSLGRPDRHGCEGRESWTRSFFTSRGFRVRERDTGHDESPYTSAAGLRADDRCCRRHARAAGNPAGRCGGSKR